MGETWRNGGRFKTNIVAYKQTPSMSHIVQTFVSKTDCLIDQTRAKALREFMNNRPCNAPTQKGTPCERPAKLQIVSGRCGCEKHEHYEDIVKFIAEWVRQEGIPDDSDFDLETSDREWDDFDED